MKLVIEHELEIEITRYNPYGNSEDRVILRQAGNEIVLTQVILRQAGNEIVLTQERSSMLQSILAGIV